MSGSKPSPEIAQGQPGILRVLGIVILLVAIAVSLALVLESLGTISMPGCGEGSACAEASASKWARVPISEDFSWPVSFLALAYFVSALAAWIGSRDGVTVLFRYVVRLSALASLGFLLIIFIEKHFCAYCIIGHATNFAFWMVMEKARRAPVRSLRPVLLLGLAFVTTSAILGAVREREEKIVSAAQEQELGESMAEIIASDREKAALIEQTAPHTSEPPSARAVSPTAKAGDPPQAPAPGEIQRPWAGGFRGRWLYGAEESPVRLVMFTDYQCKDCTRIESELREMLDSRDDVSLSIKHFPMCTDCNAHFSRNMHPNACWAARAAEAAGILDGNDGFWRMHFWLFDHLGSFTREQLNEGLVELGFDQAEFMRIMFGDETLQRVQADIAEGVWLGLHFTPMAFINGVELRGVFAKNAIPRAVAAVGAQQPPAMNHALDQPPPAIEKYVGDWSEMYRVPRMPRDSRAWPRGPDDARLKIVMWADYREEHSATADRIIRRWMAGRPDVQYAYRPFPFNQDCNPDVSSSKFPLACLAAKAAEAAGTLGGVDGFWMMHEWLMDHQGEFSEDLLREAAGGMGFDPDALFAAMDSPEVAAAIEEDARAGKPRLYRHGIPTIYVDQKALPRWRLEEKPILTRILDEAYRD